MNPYALAEVPEGDNYLRILDLSASFVEFVGFIQDSPYVADSCIDMLVASEPYLVVEEDVTKYPGATTSSPVRRLLYRYTPEMRDVIKKFAGGLFSWAQPDLPEDIHLLRQDRSTFLGTAASEDHAYLLLSDEEAERWLAAWPDSLLRYESAASGGL